MKKNNLVFISLIICTLFMMIHQVKADFYTEERYPTCTSGGYTVSGKSTPHDYFCKLYDTEGNIVYCLEITKQVSGGTLHTYKDTIEGKGQACGVLKAMDDMLISTPTKDGTFFYKTVSSDENFYEIQKRIWDYEETGNSCSRIVTKQPTTSTSNLPAGNFGISTKNIPLSIKTINGTSFYTGIVSLNYSNINSYNIIKSNNDIIISTNETGNNVTSSSEKKLYVRIPVSKVNENTTYTINFEAKYNNSIITTTTSTSTIIPFIQRFHHADNRQLLGIIGLKRTTSTDTKTNTTQATVSDSVNLNVTLPIPKITIQKKDLAGKGISGAIVNVSKTGGNSQTHEMTSETLNINSGLSYGEYCVTEVSAPSGYVLDKISKCVTLSATNPNGIVTITNKKTSVSFLKIDASTEKPLAGATLQILDKDGNVILGENNNPKYQWVSTTEKYIIDGLPVGTYYLKEVNAPSGYSLNSELIQFIINKDGSVTTGEQKNEKTAVIIMENKKTVTSFSKQDATTGKELPGATLQILDKDKNEIKDKDGKVLYQWVSTDKPHIIEGLPVGIYYLKEVIQPEGYELSEELVKFEVKSDGTVTKVVMKNTPKIPVPDTALSKSGWLIAVGSIVGLLGIGLIIFTVMRKKNSKI